MAESPRLVRVRSFLSEYLSLIVLLALLVIVAGGYLTATAYGDSGTRTETRQTASWGSSASYIHSATVVNGTAVYDEGTRLENQSVYFRTVTPRLDGSFLYAYTASEGGNLTATAETSLVFRSVEGGDEGEGTVYWQLASERQSRQTTLSPGDRLQVPFSVNITAATQRLDRIDSQFGGTPGTKELYIATELTLTGTRNGNPVDRTQTYRLPVTVSDSVYEVGSDGPVVDGGNRTEQVSVSVQPGPVRSFGGPAAVLLGLVALGCCAGGRYTGAFEVSETERDWLAYQDAREEFDDWISSARVPDIDADAVRIEVESLEDLVDIAIDTDERVLEDSERKTFFVLDSQQVYTYTPAFATADTATDTDEEMPEDEDPLAALAPSSTTDGETTESPEESAESEDSTESETSDDTSQ